MKKYGPDTKRKNRHFTHGWIVAMVCSEGLKRAGKDLTPETLVEAYESLQNFSIGGLCQPVSYGKTNHKGGRAFRLYKTDFEREIRVPITDLREPVFKG